MIFYINGWLVPEAEVSPGILNGSYRESISQKKLENLD